jgi:cytochrome c oxidase subunit II
MMFAASWPSNYELKLHQQFPFLHQNPSMIFAASWPKLFATVKLSETRAQIMLQRLGSVLTLGALIAIGSIKAQPAGQAASSEYHEFTMTAKDSGFDPSTITVKKGEKVRLIITATDCEHEFRLDAFDIFQALKKGDPEIIEFTPGKAGTFTFKSSVYCGKRHGKMNGKLIVEVQ